MKLLTLEDLVALGIAPSAAALRQRVHRLGDEALPPRVELSGSAHTYLFLESDVDRWLAEARHVPQESPQQRVFWLQPHEAKQVDLFVACLRGIHLGIEKYGPFDHPHPNNKPLDLSSGSVPRRDSTQTGSEVES